MNFTQLIDSPTRPNPKCPEKSSLIDLFITNNPHKYTSVSVFPYDVSDHCVIAAIRDTKIPKVKPRYITKRDTKHFNEQGYRYDLNAADWSRVSLIPDVELSWSYFVDLLMSIIDKHAPYKRYRVKGRENPWCSDELASLIRERNYYWAKARKSNVEAHWTTFRCLRNKCTALVKKAKSNYYLALTDKNLNNPQKFWQTIKSLSPKNSSSLPTCIVSESATIYDKAEMLNCFNKHFVSSGFFFDKEVMSPTAAQAPLSNAETPLDTKFNFRPFTIAEVHKTLTKLDLKKPAGPDNIAVYFLKIAADFIAEPLTYIYNLTLTPGKWLTFSPS